MSSGIFSQKPRYAKPLGSTSGAMSWKNTEPNTRVMQMQKEINAALAKLGYQSILVDGKLGPGTCGALVTVSVKGVQAGMPNLLNDAWYQETNSLCASYTYPPKIGTTTRVSPIDEHFPVDSSKITPQWGVKSDLTAETQRLLNIQLVAHDMQPLTVDGKLGPGTCGAMRWLEKNTGQMWLKNQGSTCQSYTDPLPAASTKPGVVVQPAVIPGVGPGDGGGSAVVVGPSTKSGISTASMVTGGLVAAAVVGGFLYAKHKGLVG